MSSHGPPANLNAQASLLKMLLTSYVSSSIKHFLPENPQKSL